MRRGRPTASPAPSQQAVSSGPKRVTDGDPFAALDSKPSGGSKAATDDISDRFPSLNQFSLLHHKGSKFDFDPKSPTTPKPNIAPKTNMADKMADSAFAASRQAASSGAPPERPHSVTPVVSGASGPASIPNIKPSASQPVSTRPVSIQPLPPSTTSSRYVSTGTMTSYTSEEKKPVPAAKPSQTLQQQPIGRSASVAVRPTAPVASQPVSKPQIRPPTPETPKFENVRGYSDFNASRPRPVSTNYDSRQHSLPDRSKISTQAIRPPSRDGSQSRQLDRSSNDSRKAANLQTGDRETANDKPRDGAFGNAFSKFEQSTGSQQSKQSAKVWSPPTEAFVPSTNIESSSSAPNPVVVNVEQQDDESDEELTPEMRRERERLQLEEEERRVANAQSEYRQRMVGAAQGKKPAPGPKPSSIQNRMQAYMAGEEQPQSSVPRTAEGYGKYADAATAASKPKMPPQIRRKPVLPGVARSSTMPQSTKSETKPDIAPVASAPSLTGLNKPTPRPPPKKPEYLNNIPAGAGETRSFSPAKNRSQNQTERLVAEDIPGQPALEWSPQDKEDYLDDFSKRFPSLSAIEGSGSGR